MDKKWIDEKGIPTDGHFMAFAQIIELDNYRKNRKNSTATKKSKTTQGRLRGQGHERAPKIADVDAVRKSLAMAEPTERNLRDRLIMEFFVRTGMRASELVLLKKSNFQTDIDGEDIIRFYRPKVKSNHVVYFDREDRDFLLDLIDRYHKLANVDSDHILFSLTKQKTHLTTRSLQRIVNGWNIRDGRGKIIACHGLRHHVGSDLSKQGDFILVSKLLGNSERIASLYYTNPYAKARK